MVSVFVPVRGFIYIYDFCSWFEEMPESVFVPVRGFIYIYHSEKINANVLSKECFRPRKGIYLYIRIMCGRYLTV